MPCPSQTSGFNVPNYVRVHEEKIMLKLEGEKELVGSLAEKELSTEGCTGRNGERENSSGRRRYQMIDNIKICGSHEETKRKTENRKDWRKLGLHQATKGNTEGGRFDPVLWIEFGVAQRSERLVRRIKDPVSRAVASWSKASRLGLALRNARWFESSWGKKFSHEISVSVWNRCPRSIVVHLGSYDM
ncbi:hypothetical protein ANN_12071 [Periplaneta americana]|uniref:Uncharacterized protein n=1 Tax=Periplaneta americana TaxID=6978 RepID=A0ABQ8T8M6_PERAM|nr:hypothetical protein ANN_12071 [Periplaneta americana]